MLFANFKYLGINIQQVPLSMYINNNLSLVVQALKKKILKWKDRPFDFIKQNKSFKDVHYAKMSVLIFQCFSIY